MFWIRVLVDNKMLPSWIERQIASLEYLNGMLETKQCYCYSTQWSWWWKLFVLCFSIANHTSIVWSKKKKVRVLVALLTMIGMSFLSWPICLLARPCDMDMTMREGHVCEKEGERVSHWRFGSTFVVDLGARHGIACHCCSQDSFVFSSSLTLEMDPDDSFIFS